MVINSTIEIIPCIYYFKKFALKLCSQNLQLRLHQNLYHLFWQKQEIKQLQRSFMLTCIFEAVLGSRKPFTEFHSSLKPLPAFTTNIWCSVWAYEYSVTQSGTKSWPRKAPSIDQENQQKVHTPQDSSHCQSSAFYLTYLLLFCWSSWDPATWFSISSEYCRNSRYSH